MLEDPNQVTVETALEKGLLRPTNGGERVRNMTVLRGTVKSLNNPL